MIILSNIVTHYNNNSYFRIKELTFTFLPVLPHELFLTKLSDGFKSLLSSSGYKDIAQGYKDIELS